MALLTDFGSSLFLEGKASADVSVLLRPADVSFNAHSLVLEHRSPMLAVLVSEARRAHEHTRDCKTGRCHLSIRVEHPFEVGLDTFNTFLRFLYTGNLNHLAQMAPQLVSSFMLLVQWYKLKLVQKDKQEKASGAASAAALANDNLEIFNGDSRDRAETAEAQRKQNELLQQEKKLQKQQQMLHQQKKQQEEQQRQLHLQQQHMMAEQQKKQQAERQWEMRRQQQEIEMKRRLNETAMQHQRNQPGLLGDVPMAKLQQLRVGPAGRGRGSGGAVGPANQVGVLMHNYNSPAAANLATLSRNFSGVGGHPGSYARGNSVAAQNSRKDAAKIPAVKEPPKRGSSANEKNNENAEKQKGDRRKSSRGDDSAAVKSKPAANDELGSKNLEIRVSNLPSGLFKHVLAERMRRELGTPVKVTWMRNRVAFVWMDYQVGRKVLAEKPRITLGTACLSYTLTKKFKSWPLQLSGFPDDVTLEELQKIFLRQENIINVEYFPKGPRRREPRTYLHFADKQSLKTFIVRPNSFSIRDGKCTLKWEIAVGDSIFKKGGFSLTSTEETDHPSTDMTRLKLKTTCEKKFGTVFFVRLATPDAGFIYFEKKSSLEEFLKSEELTVEGVKIVPRTADATGKIREKSEEDEEEEVEEPDGEDDSGDDKEDDQMKPEISSLPDEDEYEDKEAEDVEEEEEEGRAAKDADEEEKDKMLKRKKKLRVETRLTDLPLGIFKSTLAEALAAIIGESVKVKSAKGCNAFVWMDLPAAKKILSSKPDLKFGEKTAKITLASNSKKWPLQVLGYSAKSSDELTSFFLAEQMVINVEMQKAKRAIVHFVSKDGLTSFLARFAFRAMVLPESRELLDWDLTVSDFLQKASFEIFCDINAIEDLQSKYARKVTEAVPLSAPVKKDDDGKEDDDVKEVVMAVNDEKDIESKVDKDDNKVDKEANKKDEDKDIAEAATSLEKLSVDGTNDRADASTESDDNDDDDDKSGKRETSSAATESKSSDDVQRDLELTEPIPVRPKGTKSFVSRRAPSRHLQDIYDAVTLAFRSVVGEVFFVRLDPNDLADSNDAVLPEGFTDGVVYFEKKSSRQKFLRKKEISVFGGGVVIMTKHAAALKKKGHLPGSYPKEKSDEEPVFVSWSEACDNLAILEDEADL